MRTRIRLIGLAAIVSASVSCGDVVRQGSSPMYLVIDSLTPAPLRSNVRGVTSPDPCTPQTPCFASDNGTVELSTASKDFSLAPTSNNDVTINRYHVEYTRADGRNTQGVDVPYAFDGAVTVTIPAGGSGPKFEVTLVRTVAKQEAPLATLRTGTNTITTFATVTFYGLDRTGNAISVVGRTQIDFGNF